MFVLENDPLVTQALARAVCSVWNERRQKLRRQPWKIMLQPALGIRKKGLVTEYARRKVLKGRLVLFTVMTLHERSSSNGRVVSQL